MQLTILTTIILLSSLIEAHPSHGSHVSRRGPSCRSSGSSVCDQVIAGCVSSKSASNPWSQSLCVAAATCSSVGVVLDSFRCTGQNVQSATKLPSLDYNVYSSIVGPCAWAQGGCPITVQNHIDLIYGSLTKVQATSWPSSPSAITTNMWLPIVKWAATANSAIPWTNFNDWLHFSSDLSVATTSKTSSTPAVLTVTTTTSYTTLPVSIASARVSTSTYTSQINSAQAVVVKERLRIYDIQAPVNAAPIVYTKDSNGNTIGTSTLSAQQSTLFATTTLRSTPKTTTIKQIVVPSSTASVADGFLAGASPNSGSFTYMSCWTDSPSSRSLSKLLMTGATIEKCAAAAASFAYFGLEYGTECWADNVLAGSASAEISCNMKCLQNSAQTCGGFNLMNLYRNTKVLPISVPISTSTSILISYSSATQTQSSISAASTVPVIGCRKQLADSMCNDLLNACTSSGTLSNPWSKAVCVAAATCAGSDLVLSRMALCSRSSPLPASVSTALSLDSSVFNLMTGNCASCGVTQQSYIDFIYAQLTSISASNWPTSGSQLAANYFLPLVSWTATGSSIPFNNFQDALRYYTSTPSGWTLTESHSGKNFFDAWYSWGDFGVGGADPTNGVTNYVDTTTAWNQGLISINSRGNAVLKVDTTPQNWGLRNAMRIHTKKKYNVGTLAIFDVIHAPEGPGTWPAIWSYGDSWPYQGEIDIYETVSGMQTPQSSFHTSDGCSMDVNQSPFSGVLTGSPDCNSFATANSGCGIRDKGVAGGQALNAAGGMVMAMSWTRAGISMWFFPRNAVPQDITAGTPSPANWGKPTASLGGSSCDLDARFNQHSFVINTALCGDWVNGAWPWAQWENGESVSPAQSTGYGDCASYIANNGNALKAAYWEIASVKFYAQK